MAYIGRGTDKISNIEKLDTITFDGSQSYTLQKNSTNFVPVSANNLIVSIDGVVQAGNFTVSGSTIDFGVAVASTSTCDFIMHFGTGVTTQPSDGSVTTGKIQDGAVTSAKLDSGVSLGKVLQVVSATKSDTYAANGGLRTFYDITGLSLSITPASTSNKILVLATIHGQGTPDVSRFAFRLVRGSTAIGIGDAAGSRARVSTRALYDGSGRSIEATSINFLDSPSTTSATTYKIQGYQTEGTGTHYINRSSADSDSADYPRTISTITAMEIAG